MDQYGTFNVTRTFSPIKIKSFLLVEFLLSSTGYSTYLYVPVSPDFADRNVIVTSDCPMTGFLTKKNDQILPKMQFLHILIIFQNQKLVLNEINVFIYSSIIPIDFRVKH